MESAFRSGSFRYSVLKLRQLVLVAALAFGFPAASQDSSSQEAYLLILGGGRSQDDAQEALTAWKNMRRWTPSPLNLVSDYPKIVLSDSIPGLNPGFHILIGGACPVSEPNRVRDLEMAKANWDGAYLRRVQWSGEMPCPSSLHKDWSVEEVAEVSLESGRLTAWGYYFQRNDRWERTDRPPPFSWKKAAYVVIVARDPLGALIGTASAGGCEKDEEGGRPWTALDRALARKDGLVMKYYCVQSVMLDGDARYLVHDMTMTATIKGGQLKVRTTKGREHIER